MKNNNLFLLCSPANSAPAYATIVASSHLTARRCHVLKPVLQLVETAVDSFTAFSFDDHLSILKEDSPSFLAFTSYCKTEEIYCKWSNVIF